MTFGSLMFECPVRFVKNDELKRSSSISKVVAPGDVDGQHQPGDDQNQAQQGDAASSA